MAVSDEFKFANSPTTYYIGDCVVLPVKIADTTKTMYCQDLASKFTIGIPKYYENEYLKDSFAFTRYFFQQLVNPHDEIENKRPFEKKYDHSYFKFLEKSWDEGDFKSITTYTIK